MGAPELLGHLRYASLSHTLTPAGRLHVAPRTALTGDRRAVIRAERDALVVGAGDAGRGRTTTTATAQRQLADDDQIGGVM